MPARYATLNVRDGMSRSIAEMDAAEVNPIAWEKIQEKDKFKQRKKELKANLERITPPDIESANRKPLLTRFQQLKDALVKGNSNVSPMPSREQMWENHAGDTGQNTSWETYWKTHTLDDNGNPVKIDAKAGGRGGVFELKDLMRSLGKEAEAEDPDVANLERIRPDKGRISLAERHSPMSFGLSLEAKAKFDDAFPDHEPTPVEKKIATAKRVYDGPTCEAKKKDGSLCGARVVKGKKHCFSPSHRKQFAAVV